MVSRGSVSGEKLPRTYGICQMKRYSSKSVKGKLDKIVGDLYRSRPSDFSGLQTNIQWCHLKSRRYLSVRWEPLNNFSLTAGEHLYFTAHPDEFIRWIDKKYPGRIEELNKIFAQKKEMKKYQLEELLEQKKKDMEG